LDAESEFEKKAREGMNDDEAQFSVEVPLTAQAFLWSVLDTTICDKVCQ
jgi:hypothetical protein